MVFLERSRLANFGILLLKYCPAKIGKFLKLAFNGQSSSKKLKFFFWRAGG
jgi:hypothetical protein